MFFARIFFILALFASIHSGLASLHRLLELDRANSKNDTEGYRPPPPKINAVSFEVLAAAAIQQYRTQSRVSSSSFLIRILCYEFCFYDSIANQFYGMCKNHGRSRDCLQCRYAWKCGKSIGTVL